MRIDQLFESTARAPHVIAARDREVFYFVKPTEWSQDLKKDARIFMSRRAAEEIVDRWYSWKSSEEKKGNRTPRMHDLEPVRVTPDDIGGERYLASALHLGVLPTKEKIVGWIRAHAHTDEEMVLIMRAIQLAYPMHYHWFDREINS